MVSHQGMTRRRNHTRKGFNLIESAIVLAVVGLVIGGIWVAAAAVSENMKISRTESAILEIMTGFREKIPRSAWPGLGRGASEYSLWDYTEQMGLFPADFTNHQDLWDGDMDIYWSETSPTIAIYFNRLTQSRCVKLISAITAHYRDNADLVGIWIGAPSNTWHDVWPVSPANTGCLDSASLEFNFTLTRSN